MAAAADDEQVRAGRGVQQDLRRMAVDDLAPDQLAVGWLDFLADHGFDHLPGVLPEVASLFRTKVPYLLVLWSLVTPIAQCDTDMGSD